MRTLRIDFRSENILPDGCIAGRTGEHNATTLIITPPDEMLNSEEAKNFCIVFETGSEIIHSEVMVKAETLKISLWKQLTKNKCLAVQVEAYDSNGEFIAKSPTVSLILRPSLEGNKAQTDTENPDFISEFLKTKHSHENKDVLDKFGEAEDGSPIYNGKKIESSEGVGITEEQAAELAENTKARHTHNNQWNVLDLLQLDRDQLHLLFAGYGTVAYTSDVPDPIPANDINNYFGAGNPIRSGFIGRLAAMELIDQVNARFATKELVEGLGSPLKLELVEALPETGAENTIYLVPSGDTESNIYEEYLFVNGSPELIGSTQIDLTGYAKTEDIPSKTSQLVNDSNFVTAEYVTNAINGSLDEVEAMIDESGVLDE